MKIIKIIEIILLAFLCMLTGCGSQSVSQSRTLAVCGSYAVPGMLCNDLKGGTYDCEVIDTDSKGRILFSYTTQNSITDEKETVFIICQAYDSDYVYFYEDVCYLIDELSEYRIKILKEQNDWNIDLQFNKMARRAINISFDNFLIIEDELDYQKVRKACCREFQIQESQIQELYILDCNENKQVMYVLEFENDNIAERYCVLVNELYEIAYMSIDDTDTFYSEIPLFKQENGWNAMIENDT